MPAPKGTVVAEWQQGGMSWLALSFPDPANEKANIEFNVCLPDNAFKVVDGERKPLTKAERRDAMIELARTQYTAQMGA